MNITSVFLLYRSRVFLGHISGIPPCLGTCCLYEFEVWCNFVSFGEDELSASMVITVSFSNIKLIITALQEGHF